MKNRYWLFEKDGVRGSLMANCDVEYLIKDHPEHYEVSAFWYYANKFWPGLTPRAADGLITRVKSWWLAQFARR